VFNKPATIARPRGSRYSPLG